MSINRTDYRARIAALVMVSVALVSAPALAQKSGAPGSPRTPTRPLPSKAAPPGPRAAPRATPTTTPNRQSAPAASPARPASRNENTATRSAPRTTPTRTARKPSHLAPLEYSPNGPGTVSPGRHALSAGIGWPAFEVGYLYGFRENLSLGATINVAYGAGVVPTGTGSLALMGTVKWRFAKLGPVDAGLRFDLGYYLGPTSETITGHGLALNAAFLLHYQIMKGLSIEPFFAMPVRAAFSANTSTATIPLYVGVTTEYMVLPRFKVFLRVGVGGAAVVTTGELLGVSIAGTNGIPWLDITAGVGYQF